MVNGSGQRDLVNGGPRRGLHMLCNLGPCSSASRQIPKPAQFIGKIDYLFSLRLLTTSVVGRFATLGQTSISTPQHEDAVRRSSFALRPNHENDFTKLHGLPRRYCILASGQGRGKWSFNRSARVIYGIILTAAIAYVSSCSIARGSFDTSGGHSSAQLSSVA